MNQSTNKTDRIHSLDALRAVMMMLGLVLHSALTYNVTVHGEEWPLKDPLTQHLFSDAIVLLIHTFRMPIFFFIAGFFGAMLFYERQIRRMIKNRIARIVYPFVVFMFILWPINSIAYEFTKASFSNQENPLAVAFESLSSVSAFIPYTTAHLWFLYYLIMITGITVLMAIVIKKTNSVSQKLYEVFDWVIQRPIIRLLVFSALTFLLLSLLSVSMVNTSTSLVPDVNTLLYFLYFYLIGWLMYSSKKHLESFFKFDWISVILAIVLLGLKGMKIQSTGVVPFMYSLEMALYSSTIVILFMFGITGLFVRYTSTYSPRMRYLSDSSYWVYLIHLPIVAFLPGLIWRLAIPAIFKFLIVVFTATMICFVSYHFLVRNTFIGQFLNGRKYPRK